MRRADRLFKIVQILRSGRLVTSQALAKKLEVSARTIYRDVLDLRSSGVPIEGEAGVGYVLRSGFDLPPLMFDRDEVIALVMGLRLTQAWGGASIRKAAESALEKIEVVLPEKERSRVSNTQIYAMDFMMVERVRALFDQIERACDRKEVQSMVYCDEAGRETSRRIRPLGLWFWGKVWTLVAWCELRADFRVFRLDRIESCASTGEIFALEPDKAIEVFEERMRRTGRTS